MAHVSAKLNYVLVAGKARSSIIFRLFPIIDIINLYDATFQEIVKRLQPCIIKHGEAIRLRAKQDLIDKKGKYATNITSISC